MAIGAHHGTALICGLSFSSLQQLLQCEYNCCVSSYFVGYLCGSNLSCGICVTLTISGVFWQHISSCVCWHFGNFIKQLKHASQTACLSYVNSHILRQNIPSWHWETRDSINKVMSCIVISTECWEIAPLPFLHRLIQFCWVCVCNPPEKYPLKPVSVNYFHVTCFHTDL